MTDLLSTIAWGTAQPDTAVSVRFVPLGGQRDGGEAGFPDIYTSEGWGPSEVARMRLALDSIAAVCNLRFTIVADEDADLQLVRDTDEMEPGLLAFFQPPGEANAGVGVFNAAATGWDIPSGALDPGGFGFATLVHELLHGLGFAHPHDTGGTSTVMKGVRSDFDDFGHHGLNQGVFTAMSYNGGHAASPRPLQPDPRGAWGYEMGPMALDIALLQRLYGANMATAAGDTTHLLPRDDGRGTGWRAIWDAGGSDTIRYDGPRGAVIDLRAATLQEAAGGGGYLSHVDGVSGGFTIAHGVTIEAARSGAGDDRLTGNNADNLLVAGDGDDRLRGAGGDDRLWGGPGRDWLEAGAGHDALQGGPGRDALRAGTGDDRLAGGGCADLLRGQGGADHFVFTLISDSRTGGHRRDTIADFTRGLDRVDLSWMDADRGAAGDQAFRFRGDAAFTGAAGELRFARDGRDLRLLGDIDGDGRAEIEIALTGLTRLGLADLML